MAAAPGGGPAAARLLGVEQQGDGTWTATCSFAGGRLTLGVYSSSEAAARAADLGAVAEEQRKAAEAQRQFGERVAAGSGCSSLSACMRSSTRRDGRQRSVSTDLAPTLWVALALLPSAPAAAACRGG